MLSNMHLPPCIYIYMHILCEYASKYDHTLICIYMSTLHIYPHISIYYMYMQLYAFNTCIICIDYMHMHVNIYLHERICTYMHILHVYGSICIYHTFIQLYMALRTNICTCMHILDIHACI